MDNKRIAAIAGMIRPGRVAADIGSDHAQLALYMLQNEMVPAMIVSDIHAGPFNRACQAANASIFRDRIDVRRGDGLQILKKGEADTVIIAGMGGDTIVHILAYDLDKSRSFGRFVLQPMSRPQMVRKFLAAQGWPLLEEKVIGENGRLFIIIKTCPGEKPYHLSPLEMDIGPLILAESRQNVVKQYLYYWLEKYRSAAAGLNNARNSELKILKLEYKDKINRLEEILNGS